MELKLNDILRNVYYGTLRQIIEDLVKQVNDMTDFYGVDGMDKNDTLKCNKLILLIKEAILVYCGEGGVPLKNTKFESFVTKYFPDIVDGLRKN